VGDVEEFSQITTSCWAHVLEKNHVQLVYQGCTGSKCYRWKDYFIKFGQPSEISKELRGYKILKPYLGCHLPPIIDVQPGIIVLPFLVDYVDFHEVILGANVSTSIQEMYRNFLEVMQCRLWLPSMKNEGENPDFYVKRIFERTALARKHLILAKGLPFERLFRDRFRIVVNGLEYPSLPCMIEDAVHIVKHYSFRKSFLLHGDEHARNILVPKNGRTQDWVIIDCPNTHRGDYLFSISKGAHWLLAFCFIEALKAGRMSASVQVRVVSDWLEIEYQKSIPQLCFSLLSLTLSAADTFAQLLGDVHWKKRFSAALFTVLYGAIGRHLNMPSIAAILIGEAAKALYSTPDK
jgi:hypothetical protein